MSFGLWEWCVAVVVPACSVTECSDRVLAGLYLATQEEDMAHTSIRFGIGRFTTEAEIDHAAGKPNTCCLLVR